MNLQNWANFKLLTLKCNLSVIQSAMNMVHITTNIKHEYSRKLSHLS